MTHPNMERTEHTPPLPLEVLHSTIELVTDVSNFDDADNKVWNISESFHWLLSGNMWLVDVWTVAAHVLRRLCHVVPS